MYQVSNIVSYHTTAVGGYAKCQPHVPDINECDTGMNSTVATTWQLAGLRNIASNKDERFDVLCE